MNVINFLNFNNEFAFLYVFLNFHHFLSAYLPTREGSYLKKEDDNQHLEVNENIFYKCLYCWYECKIVVQPL